MFGAVLIFLASLFGSHPIELKILETPVWSSAVFVVLSATTFILSLLPKELRKNNAKVDWTITFMIILFAIFFFTIFGSPNIEPKVSEKVVWISAIFAVLGAISALSALQDKRKQKQKQN